MLKERECTLKAGARHSKKIGGVLVAIWLDRIAPMAIIFVIETHPVIALLLAIQPCPVIASPLTMTVAAIATLLTASIAVKNPHNHLKICGD
jgi:hypothetical protein